jgi:predicted hydrocarbon binding protein
VKEDDICVLHSDRELELEEELRIKPKGSIENVLLSHEYMQLFAHIIPYNEVKGFTQFEHIVSLFDDSLSFFKQALGLAESVEEVEKVFRLSLKEGEMFNPIDRKRNISLRSETLCGMLDKIYNKHIERSNKEEVDKSFFDSGKTCGESFGKELMEEVWKDKSLSIQERLDKWCAFDSEVGLGKFSNKIDNIDDEGHITSGKIILKNNPFASNRSSKDPNLCSFMTGYIEGVLTKITDTNIEVTHNQQDCMQYQSGKKVCDFYFRRAE